MEERMDTAGRNQAVKLRRRLALCGCVLVGIVACGPSRDGGGTGSDAASDAGGAVDVVDTGVAVDAGGAGEDVSLPDVFDAPESVDVPDVVDAQADATRVDGGLTSCTSSRQCPGQVCNLARGVCVDCNVEGDCPMTQTCRDNLCVDRPRPCTTSRQCSDLALVCDTTQGFCVECIADTDCLAGMQYCAAGGRCVPRECLQTDVRCVSGVREVCNARGTGFTPMPCGSNQSCVDGACVDRVCAPGARRCVMGDPSRIETCNAEGLAFSESACPMGQSCSGGTCVPYRCTPLSTRCAGPTSVQTCDRAGLAFGATEACPAGQGCNAAAQACRVFACNPGSAVCAGSSGRSVCAADGQGSTVVPCGSSESCLEGTCRARVCSPGVRRCLSGSVGGYEVCQPDGLGYAGASCAPGESCSGGACVRQLCTPGVSRCVSGSNATEVCRPDGLGYESPRTCPIGTACSSMTGTCGSWICTPGTASCLDAATRRVCNPDGLGYATTACSSAQTCSAGACIARDCVPGEYSCLDVNTRRICNRDGLGYAVDPCAASQACVGAGQCAAWVCTPGSVSPVCTNATARQVCTPDGQGYVTVACPLGQECIAGQCAPPCGAPGEPVCTDGRCDPGVTACGVVCRNTQTDVTACGPMCTRCGTPSNGTAQCVAGVCTAVCNTDRFNPVAGACVPCGGSNQPACVSGAACNAGYTNMAGTCRDCPGSVVGTGNTTDATCAAMADGSVRCWGRNAYGQLGNNTTTNSLVPVIVQGLSSVQEVAGGYYHVCARQTSGGVQCWGYNTYGVLGDGTTTNRSVPVQVSGITTGATSLGSGYLHTCAVVNGGVRCWGYNANGQLGDGTSTNRPTPVNVSGLSAGVVQVVAGYLHTCALLNTGAVRCWGRGTEGQLGDGTMGNRTTPVTPSGLTAGVVRLAAGYYHTCAVLSSGQMRCWGYNAFGQLGNNTLTNSLVPAVVAGLSTATDVVAGFYHTCARLSDATARCWGRNTEGQLGDGSTTQRPAPTLAVSGLSGVTSLSAGYYSTCARLSSGAAWCWGQNAYGQVGDGTTTNRPLPTRVANLGSGC